MQSILIVDDDAAVSEALALALERPGRRLTLSRDLESAQLVVESSAPDIIITDIRLTGPFRFEGLDFIEDVRRHSPHSKILVMTGAMADGLEREARARGAHAILQKPLDVRDLEREIPEPVGNGEPVTLDIPTMDEILAGGRLVPSFQPIVCIAEDGVPVHGHESLARFDGPFFGSPDVLFEYASRRNSVVELDLACLRETLRHANRIAPDARIFANLHPRVVSSDRLAGTLREAARASGIAPRRIVLEITEQGSLGDSELVGERCDEIRGMGFTFALDDVGVAYSHLSHIGQIRPAYLKVSQEFGTGFETDSTRRRIVRNILSLARDFQCELILEGIETEGTAAAARSLGIRYGQGYYFGRPRRDGHALME